MIVTRLATAEYLDGWEVLFGRHPLADYYERRAEWIERSPFEEMILEETRKAQLGNLL